MSARQFPRFATVSAVTVNRQARITMSLLLFMAHIGVVNTASAQGAGVNASDTVFVYGPGGPLPAMKQAAEEFSRKHGVHVVVTGGPAQKWLTDARQNADVVFSGAEHMMTDFVHQLADTTDRRTRAPNPGRIDKSTIYPLYLRPVGILVRPGNPRGILRFEDLLRPGMKVLVVQGAGQTGLWEDVAGRTGEVAILRAFRRNIGAFSANSGEAKERWSKDQSFDAWLIWNVWQVANPGLADFVSLAEPWRIYRDMGIALTVKGRDRTLARDFVEYLRSDEAAPTFGRWGWMTQR